MTQTITIDPVTRIEGHGKITIYLDESGQVEDAQFHVTQLRGFEKLSEGRPFREMPALMARVCGICPVSHLITAAKACDELLAVRIPDTAVHLRHIMTLAQMVQSHALSFFYLSAPDLLLGMDSDPAKRHLLGMAEADAELARGGVRLRQFGQQIIEQLGGKRIHPAWVIPGGVSAPLTAEKREHMLSQVDEALAITERALAWYLGLLSQFEAEVQSFANFPTMYMGLVNVNEESGETTLAFYDGTLRMIDAQGEIVNEEIAPYAYQDFIGEAVEPHSYLKSPYYKPLGYPEGTYRVGPLARVNMVDRAGTPRADAALAAFKEMPVDARQSSFHFHYARLIEMLYGIERIESLLRHDDILDTHVQAVANPNDYEGVGIAEAPRGTLLHHYRIDDHGLVTWANLIIATGHNNLAMNRGVKDVAQRFVRGDKLEEGMLNRVEAVIRTFDPCLSCSTHAVGQMPLHVELRGPDRCLLDVVERG